MKKPGGAGALLDPHDRVAVIAGSGVLPVLVAQKFFAQGNPPFVLRIRGEADMEFAGMKAADIELENFIDVAPTLRRENITHIVLAGGISRRPALRAFKPGLALIPIAIRLAKNLLKGDDSLLKSVVAYFEEQGFHVLGTSEVLPDLCPSVGAATRRKPGRSHLADMEIATSFMEQIGSYDLGQAVVVIRGRVVAVEGPEGTDAMLARVARLRELGKIATKTGGILLKCAKPGQELRVDLPSIGKNTVIEVKKAGLDGIVLQADHSLVLQREETIALADSENIFIWGLQFGH